MAIGKTSEGDHGRETAIALEGIKSGQKDLQKRISDHGAKLHAAAVAKREREAAAQAAKSGGRAKRGR